MSAPLIDQKGTQRIDEAMVRAAISSGAGVSAPRIGKAGTSTDEPDRPTEAPAGGAAFGVPARDSAVDRAGKFTPPPVAEAVDDPAKRARQQKRILIFACVGLLFVAALVGLSIAKQRADAGRAAEAGAERLQAQQRRAQELAARAAAQARERAAALAAADARAEEEVRAARAAREAAAREAGRGTVDPAALEAAELAFRYQSERAAVDLVVANDFRGALAEYVRLAHAYPDEPAFAQMVLVLRQKTRCADGSPGDGPCE